MGNKVLISVDSTCDLPKELLKERNIRQIPLYITVGEETYLDGLEITPDEIYARYEKEGVLPKTAAISIGDFVTHFKNLLEEADQIIHFSLSSCFSCTYQNACLAAEEFPGRVFNVDTMNLSTGEALTILHAQDMLDAGATAQEILEDVSLFVKCVDASFVIESLEFLHKGGRCSTVAALGANLLSIKPCIEVRDGKMDVGKKYRGKFKAVLGKYIEDCLAIPNLDTHRAVITHAGCDPELVQFVKGMVEKDGRFEELLLTRAGCTISSHCGPNTLGLLMVRKDAF
ncbi:MAG: DegV family protein [Clostridia bacterium]|nr:DegV family protein [Clostridia bacterium]